MIRIAETRAGKYREKTTQESIQNFESMIQEMRRTQPNFCFNRDIYDLNKNFRTKKLQRS